MRKPKKTIRQYIVRLIQNRKSPFQRLVHLGCGVIVMANMITPAIAAPQGASVVHGQVNIQQNGLQTTIAASNNAIINFKSFNIASQETVKFVQPNARSRVLNRVTDGRITTIDGMLKANGHVYIANPAGIFFGGHAVVSTNGITAAAGTISDANFLAGIDHFTQVQGEISQAGTINAQTVQLIGAKVANLGSIVAPQGIVTMVAGEDVYLSQPNNKVMVQVRANVSDAASYGVENSGSIAAAGGQVNLGAADIYVLAVNQSGQIQANQVALQGDGGKVQVGGVIDATNAKGVGGQVHVLGDQVALLNGAVIDASGQTGGGEILMGGDFQGQGDVPTATRTYVDQNVQLHADANQTGDGGRIIVWADDRTAFYGQLTARGGERSGNGGFAEVSGKQDLVAFSGDVDLTAANGLRGRLLLDPKNGIVDVAGGSVLATNQFFADNVAGTSTLNVADIVTALDGANVDLQFSNDFTLNTNLDATTNVNGGDLSIKAGRSVFLNASLFIKGNVDLVSNVNFNSGADPTQRDVGAAVFTMAVGTSIDTTSSIFGGSVFLAMEQGFGRAGGRETSGDMTVQFVNVVGNDMIGIRNMGQTAGSDVFVKGSLLSTFGGVDIETVFGSLGKVVIDGSVTTGLGRVGVLTFAGISMGASGQIQSASGHVELQALKGDFFMADGAVINAGTGEIMVMARDNITVGRLLSVSNRSEAIVVASTMGQIIDGGDTGGEDISTAVNSSVVLSGTAVGHGNGLEFVGSELSVYTQQNNGEQSLNITGGLSRFEFIAGTGTVNLNFGDSATDTDDLFDVQAGTLNVTVAGVGNYGTTVNPINHQVTIINSTISGGTMIDNNSTDLIITVANNKAVGQGNISVVTTGNLTISAPHSTLDAGAGIELKASGNLTIQSTVSTAGDNAAIELLSGGTLTLNDNLTTTGLFSDIYIDSLHDVVIGPGVSVTTTGGGIVEVLADGRRQKNAGKVIMADTAIINSGSGTILVEADGDVSLSQLMSTSIRGSVAAAGGVNGGVNGGAGGGGGGGGGGAAVTVRSHSGSIIDGGDTGGDDVMAVNGGIDFQADTGIGDLNAIELDATNFTSVVFSSGGVNIAASTALALDDVINLGTAGVNVDVLGNLSTNPDAFLIFNGQNATLTSTNNLTINSPLVNANLLVLAAGKSGVGDLTFGRGGLFVSGQIMIFVAGDGLGGGDLAFVDTATNLPRFVDQATASAPSQIRISQDALIDTTSSTFLDIYHQIGPTMDVSNTQLNLLSRTSSVSVNFAGASANGLGLGNLTVNGQTDVTLLGSILAGSFDIIAHNRLLQNAGLVSSGVMGSTFRSIQTVQWDGTFDTGGKSVGVTSDIDIFFGSGGAITGAALGPRDAVVIVTNPNNQAFGVGGQLTMADGALIDNGTGRIEMRSDGNMTLGQLVSFDNSDFAVSIDVRNGSLIDGGNIGGPDIVVPNGQLSVTTLAGIGTIIDPLETQVKRLSISQRGPGLTNINQLGSLDIIGINQQGAGDLTIIAHDVNPTTIRVLDATLNGNGIANLVGINLDGNLFFHADDIFVENLVSNNTGQTFLEAHNDVRFSSTGQLTNVTGDTRVVADMDNDANGFGGGVFMDPNTVIDGGSGLIVIRSDEDINVGLVKTTSASNIAIDIISRSGGVVDAGATATDNFIAPNGTFLAITNTGFGNVNAIEVQVNNFQVTNTTSGGVRVAGDTLNIGHIDQQGPGLIFAKTTVGDLNIIAGGGGVTGTSGMQFIDSFAQLNVNDIVTTGSGLLALRADTNVNLFANVLSTSGKVSIEADHQRAGVVGAVSFGPSVILNAGSGQVDIFANDDIRVTQIQSMDAVFAIRIESLHGGIIDATAGGVDNFSAPNNGIRLFAETGIGDVTPLRFSTTTILANNSLSGGIRLQSNNNIEVLGIDQQAPAGMVEFTANGSLTLGATGNGINMQNGPLSITTIGANADLHLNNNINKGTGAASFLVDHQISFSSTAVIDSTSGVLDFQAGLDTTLGLANFTMADGAMIIAGSGNVSVNTTGQISLAHIGTTATANNAIDLNSTDAGIVDNGDTHVDLQAPNGGLIVNSLLGFGIPVSPAATIAIETEVARITNINVAGTGPVNFSNTGNLSIANLFTNDGPVTVGTSGNMLVTTINSSTVDSGVNDINLNAGGVLDIRGQVFAGALNDVTLRGGDSVIDSNATVNTSVVVTHDLAVSALHQIGQITDPALFTGTPFRVDVAGTVTQLSTGASKSFVEFINGVPTFSTGAITPGGVNAGTVLFKVTGDFNATNLQGAFSVGTTDHVGLYATNNLLMPTGFGLSVRPASLTLQGDNDILRVDGVRIFSVSSSELTFTSGNAGGAVTLDTSVDLFNAKITGGSNLSLIHDIDADLSIGTVETNGGALTVTVENATLTVESPEFGGGGITTLGGSVLLEAIGSPAFIQIDNVVDAGNGDIDIIADQGVAMGMMGRLATQRGWITVNADANGNTIGNFDMAPGSMIDSVTGHGDLSSGGPMVLQGVTVNGELLAKSTNAGITADGPVQVSGNVVFTVASGHSIVAANASNNITGTVTFAPTSGSTLMDVGFVNQSPFTLAGMSLDGTLNVEAPQVIVTNNLTSNMGDLIFLADVILSNDVVFIANNVRFDFKVDSDALATPRSLIVNTFHSGLTTFVGSIGTGANGLNDNLTGDDRPLSHLQTNADGRLEIFASKLVLNGASALFENPARINADLEISEHGDGAVEFASTLDGPLNGVAVALIVNTPGGGDTIFRGDVGGERPLGTLQTDAVGTTILASNITATQSINIQDNIIAEPTSTGGTPTLASASVSTLNVTQGTVNTTTITTLSSIAEVVPTSETGNTNQDFSGQSASQMLQALGISMPSSLVGPQAASNMFGSYMNYLSDAAGIAGFDAQSFAQYLKNSPQESKTLQALNDLAQVVSQLNASGADASQIAAVKEKLLAAITPQGITAEQMQDVLEAL